MNMNFSITLKIQFSPICSCSSKLCSHSRADQIIGNDAKESLLKPINSAMEKHLRKYIFKVLFDESFFSVFRDFETVENNTRNNNCIILLPSGKLVAYIESFKFNGRGRFSIVCRMKAELQLH